jgi:uncharacterized protein (DUF427 family)
LRVVLDGNVIAQTSQGFRVLETSHPPNYYFPPDDVDDMTLARSGGASWCEFKGRAHYGDVRAGNRIERDAAWGFDDPSPGFEPIRGYVAFYPGMDASFVETSSSSRSPAGSTGDGSPMMSWAPSRARRERSAGDDRSARSGRAT